MRLLHINTTGALGFVDLDPTNPQKYAILSHTWSTTQDDEVTYKDVLDGSAALKPAYHKLLFCIERIKADELSHFWIDTCCIDKTNIVELAEAIRCMYRWYSNAKRCYVLLTDVVYDEDAAVQEQSIRSSRWFTRGWTLQELLAPKEVEFFSSTGRCLGTKHTLTSLINDITSIPSDAIKGQLMASYYGVEERFGWQRGRQTAREEDIVYSLLGIFNIPMGIRYGEGEQNARKRLLRKLQRDDGQESNFFVPFGRDENYIKNEQYDQAKAIMSVQNNKTLALAGLGGVGKSQLAIEYCYDLNQREPHIWVLWIPCSHPARFDQAIRELVIDMKIPGSAETTADCFQLLFAWLNDDRRKWIVILDSLDDAEFLFEIPEQDQNIPTQRRASVSHKLRHHYIPRRAHGALLVTTRDRAVTSKLGISDDKIILVQPQQELAEKLIDKRLGKSTTPKLTKQLASKLDFMPLAIAQAASYINQSQGRSSPQQYITMIDQNEDVLTRTLSQHSSDLGYRRDLVTANNSILRTWQVSFEHIWQTRRSAAYLLALMSFYNHEEIPEWLVKAKPLTPYEHPSRSVDRYLLRASTFLRSLSSTLGRHNDPENDTMEGYDITGFEDDLCMLRDYSFVEPAKRRSRFQMQRLVSIAAQAWLKTKPQQYQWWQAQSLRKLAAAFYGHGAYARWDKARALYPHAKLAQEFKIVDMETRHAQATVLHVAAWFANEKGAFHEALKMICKSVAIFVACRGKEHRDTLASMSEHAWTLWNLQRLEEVETLQREILAIRVQQLGQHHPATVLSLEKLALFLKRTDRKDQADALLAEARKSRRTLHAWPTRKAHTMTLSEINSLEVQFWGQGAWHEAEQLQLGVLATCEEVFGNGHKDTMMVRSHLAATYLHGRQYERARTLLLQCVEGQERLLGADHPQTQDSKSWLADVEKSLAAKQEKKNRSVPCPVGPPSVAATAA